MPDSDDRLLYYQQERENETRNYIGGMADKIEKKEFTLLMLVIGELSKRALCMWMRMPDNQSIIKPMKMRIQALVQDRSCDLKQ